MTRRWRAIVVGWGFTMLGAVLSGGCGGGGASAPGTGAAAATTGTGGDGGAGGSEGGFSSSGGAGGEGGSGGSQDDGCPLYQQRCGGDCIPTSVDPSNCGGCGVTCQPSEVCWGSGCTDSCPPGLEPCAGSCVDIKSDSQHCNGCGIACDPGEGCVDGTCHPAVPVGPPPAVCDDGGPPIKFLVPDPEAPDCAGKIAQTKFTWAICSCKDVVVNNPLLTDAYDSGKGPYVPGGLGGGVGLNGDFVSTAIGDIYGAFWSSNSTGGISLSNATNVHLELHDGGPLVVGNPVWIGADAYVAGEVNSSDVLTIAGTLHQPAGESVIGQVNSANYVNEPVSVPPPCACDEGDLLPIGAIISAHQATNDNAAIGLDPGALINPGGPTRLDLGCGRYYLSGIDTNSPMVIATSGRTALFIGGDVTTGSPLAFVVEPGGELDVLVSGQVTSSAKMSFGSPSYPALARLYIDGVGNSLTLSNDVQIGGFVYLARGKLDMSNPLEIYGGIFAGDFLNSGSTTIHYDEHVLSAGEPCDDPEDGCGSCEDCGNQACIDGECGECTESSQCCPPLVCANGTCRLVPE